MNKYLITYEYKVKNGNCISTKTTTEILTKYELEDLTECNDFYDGYMKVLFLKEL